ncbi:MAG TPA: divalent metal cation transporter, partial [Candidatus Acidoferrales bacterium]|nr:divalent metal cation transporter [Candidatus Acidoferrales bacterium]
CTFYLSYIFSAVLAHPNWVEAATATVVPHISFQTEYLLTLTALVGTTIAPWQFFYLQAGFVEKKVRRKQYNEARLDVLIGSISCMAIVFFIIVCCGATLHASGHTAITDAAGAAQALEPLAGKWAAYLFAFGLLNASLFAASILPLSTAHVVCEGLGFEAGLDQKFKEAPVFYWLYTALVVVGGLIILIPGAPLLKILVLSQVANGVWLPIVLIFMILLSNRKDLMSDKVNGPVFNAVAWVSSGIMIALTVILLVQAIRDPGSVGM